MATLRKEIGLKAHPDQVWSVIEDFGSGPVRMAPGFVIGSRIDEQSGDMDSGDIRVVDFADGTVVRERFVGIDPDTRRIVYSVLEFDHNNSSMQVLADGEGGSRFIWIHDVLPDALAGQLEAAMNRGLDAIRLTFDLATAPQ